MLVRISTQAGVPIYLQIVNQVKNLVACGRLSPGDELPPIRTLAVQLLINQNTVARAYRELEAAGVVKSRMGSGTFITGNSSPLTRRERTRLITEHVDALLTEVDHLNFDLKEVVDLMQKRHEERKTEGRP